MAVGARRVGLAILVCMAGVIASCSSTSGSPSVTTADPPTVTRWAAGDSISSGWSKYFATKPTYVAGVGGAKFVARSSATIESNTLAALGTTYHPSLVIVNGGANDYYESTAATIAAMAHFEATMTSRGIKTVWVTEPAYPTGYATQLAPLNAWVLTRPFHIDCNPVVVPLGSSDGIHPTEAGYRALTACIEAAY